MSTVSEPTVQDRPLARRTDHQTWPGPEASSADRLPAPWPAGAAAGLLAVPLAGGGAVVWTVTVATAGLLGLVALTLPRYERSTSTRPARVLFGTALVATAAGVLAGLPAEYLRALVVVPTAAAAVAALAASRIARHRSRAAVLFGSRRAVSRFLGSRPSGLRVVAACPTDADDGPADPVESARAAGASTIVWLDEPDLRQAVDPLRQLSWQIESAGLELLVATPLRGVADDRVTPRRIGDLTMLAVRSSRRQPVTVAAKRAIDLCVATVLLALCAVPLLVVVMLIRLDSPGPALFRQRRVGRHGEEFTVYKLRTMTQNAEARLAELTERNEAAGPLFKIRLDPRITRVGRVLRKSSMDELPQLLNVIRGEMSLIGPRPALPAEVAEYDATQARRLAVLPGMTGLWQVSGRSGLSWHESVALDNFYADNWTIGRDLGIAARTVRAVVTADGAM